VLVLDEIGNPVSIEKTLEQGELPFIMHFDELYESHKPSFEALLKFPVHLFVQGSEERPDVTCILAKISTSHAR